MIHMTFGPLEGVLFVFVGPYLMKSIHEGTMPLRGLKVHRVDVMPHTWETIDDKHFTLRMEDLAFRGTLASLEDDISPLLHVDITFGCLGHHPLALDIILEARV
jgi:hypothetical protein